MTVLQVLLLAGPPSGRLAKNRTLQGELAEEFPLSQLLPPVRLGGDGLPRFSPKDDAEQRDDALVSIEVQHIQTLGSLSVEALARGLSRHGAPSDDEMVELLRASAGCDEAGALALARAVRRFEAGDFEAAAYTALPLIERVARQLLIHLDAPVYPVQRERTPGQYMGLGALISALGDHGLDESWARFLRACFAAPNGMNLRNELSHGFVAEPNRFVAGLVILSVLYLAMLPRLAPPALAERRANHRLRRWGFPARGPGSRQTGVQGRRRQGPETRRCRT